MLKKIFDIFLKLYYNIYIKERNPPDMAVATRRGRVAFIKAK